MRLSIFIADKYNISRRNAKDYIKNGFVTQGKSIITKDMEVAGNNDFILNINKAPVTYNINDIMLYKDENYLFLYKPPFMHSERQNPEETLTVSDIYNDYKEYTPISRLDYEADGVLGAYNKKNKITTLSKSYYAIVSGDFYKNITISNKIDADNKKKVKVLDDNNGFIANMKKIEYNGKYSLISVTLEKAARHQVRAFSAYLSHPILGDKLYGGDNFKRLCLHCYSYTINNKTITCQKQTGDFLLIYKNLK